MLLTVLEQIVGAVADAEGTPPSELDVSLQNWVDTDAIKLLMTHDNDDWLLEFELPDHTVTMIGDEVICVDGAMERDFS